MKYLAILGLLVAVMPAFAHHPGERLDEVMADKEPAFEPTDIRSMQDLALNDEQGAWMTLLDLRESIVVLSFVPSDCRAPCVEQQGILAAVQEQVNITPMKQIVKFLTIRDRHVSIDAPWERTNWQTAFPQDEEATESARRFAALSEQAQSSLLVHVIDRGGRHAGLFHGTEFQQINLVHYINGLTNAPPAADESEPVTWWNSLKGMFK